MYLQIFMQRVKIFPLSLQQMENRNKQIISLYFSNERYPRPVENKKECMISQKNVCWSIDWEKIINLFLHTQFSQLL